MIESNCGVYSITNKLNGKRNVGSSIDIKRRWGTHRSTLRRGCHCSNHLQNAWNKYGEENFKFEMLEYTSPEDTFKIEQYYIDWMDSANREHGYNINPVVIGPQLANSDRLDEFRKFCSESQLGKRSGEMMYNAKLTFDQADEIRKLYKENIDTSYSDLAKKFDVRKGTIRNILKGISYVRPEEYGKIEIIETNWDNETRIKRSTETKRRQSKMTWEKVKEIRKRAVKESHSSLAKEFGVSAGNISALVANRSWFDPDYNFESSIKIVNGKRILSEKHKKNISKGNKGHPSHWLGKKFSKEHRLKLAKLTQEQVEEIRKEYQTGNYFEIDIWKKYNALWDWDVSRGCIQGVIRNTSWYDPDYIYIPRYKRRKKD